MPASSRLNRLLALIVCGLVALQASAETWTPNGDFLRRLAEPEQLATGVHELSEQERANLENLVSYEVASARAGNVNGFAGTFSSRRTESELEATGIERLSDEQRDRLDEHIAGYLADTPSVPYLTRSERGRSRGAAKTEADGAFDGKGPKLEVHGSVTLEVGTGSGGTYYGGSLTTVISDPKGRFNAVISYGTTRGDMPYYYDSRYYDQRGPYRRP